MLFCKHEQNKKRGRLTSLSISINFWLQRVSAGHGLFCRSVFVLLRQRLNPHAVHLLVAGSNLVQEIQNRDDLEQD